MNLLIKKKITLPIYDAVIYLIVAHDIYRERKKMGHIFGTPPHDDNYQALLSYDEAGTFGLFFEPKFTDIKTVAHEVFHLTHRILDWTNSNFDKDHHEQAAMLCGYLNEWAMGQINKFRKRH